VTYSTQPLPARQRRNANVPKPTDVEGDKFRAGVWGSILDLEAAAKAMSRWTVADVQCAIRTESMPHVRRQMTDGLTKSLTTLAPYQEVIA
jgi:hypothetical protein